jgi:hypothetical protein
VANNVTTQTSALASIPTSTVLATFELASGAQVGVTLEGAQATTAVAAGTSANTVIKASKGTLAWVLVTATGTAAVLIYDNATTNSGTIIGYIPANAAPGSRWPCGAPAANGITVDGDAALPAITVAWA